jgi:hypothetical protein
MDVIEDECCVKKKGVRAQMIHWSHSHYYENMRNIFVVPSNKNVSAQDFLRAAYYRSVKKVV